MEEICKRAIEVYGAESQMLMCIEEMSELTKELCKEHRGKGVKSSIAEEIADVQITLAQMIMLFDISDDVQCFRQIKLDRLRKRMEGVKDGIHHAQC